MQKKIIVSGVGCCLVDRVYNNISFSSDKFKKYLSANSGDGGLVPGNLVFREEFEKYSGLELNQFLDRLSIDKEPHTINIGGPSIVSLIHAAQLCDPESFEIRFYGREGNDENGRYLISALRKTPVILHDYQLTEKSTPSTVVLSDPNFDHGHGERIFINSIGAAWDYKPEDLDDDFFDSDVVVFGGTALVPPIHDNLEKLLGRAKSKGCFTIVNTVYDFRNEKASPNQKWPMGESDKSYGYIDLLIVNFEEALRLSGQDSLDDAIAFFKSTGTGAVIVTNGSRNIRFCVNNEKLFKEISEFELPISKAISEELKSCNKGDTTGCGDNFVGGVIYSVVSQLSEGQEQLDLKEAGMWGVVSGGYACFYIGGTYFDKRPGEKRRLITPYYERYIKQIND